METKNTCHNANHICDKSQYNEATLWEKLKLNLHLIYCRACRTYSSRNLKLTKTVKKSNIETVSMQEKEMMKARIEEHTNTSQGE